MERKTCSCYLRSKNIDKSEEKTSALVIYVTNIGLLTNPGKKHFLLLFKQQQKLTNPEKNISSSYLLSCLLAHVFTYVSTPKANQENKPTTNERVGPTDVLQKAHIMKTYFNLTSHILDV